MEVRIHFTMPDGFEDSLIIEADDIAGIREKAANEVARRNATDPWSEEID